MVFPLHANNVKNEVWDLGMLEQTGKYRILMTKLEKTKYQ
jgi:hypothetical protein